MAMRETGDREIEDILCRSLPPTALYFSWMAIEASLNNLALQLKMITRCDLGSIDGMSNCPLECEEYQWCSDRRQFMFDHRKDLSDLSISTVNDKAKRLIESKEIGEGVDWLE